MRKLTDVAKRRLGGISLVIATFLLMILQLIYEFIPILTDNSKRIYTESLFISIAVGIGLISQTKEKIVKFTLLTWITLNGVYLLMGGGWINDAIGLGNVDLSDRSFDYFLLAVGEGWGDQVSSVINAIVLAVPAVILIVGVITIFGAENSNEYQEAMIEIGLAVILLVVYGIVQYFV